jgi:hypothetical protein
MLKKGDCPSTKRSVVVGSYSKLEQKSLFVMNLHEFDIALIK